MAKLKKTTAKRSTRTTTSSKANAARAGKSITESAQQIWLAGMGAFNRAQAEGSKLFETLVRDGLSLEQTARKFAGGHATVMRGAVEGRVDQARERAVDTWDKLEKVFEERVQRALETLGVPGRDDLNALTQRVEKLTDELRKLHGGASKPTKAAAKPKAKPTAKPKAKSATKPAAKAAKVAKPRPVVARKAAVKTAAPKAKSVRKPVAKSAAKPASDNAPVTSAS